MSNKNNKGVITNVITKREVIKSLAEDFSMSVNTISSIYNCLENKIGLMLAKTNNKTNVEIRLFDGIKIESQLLPRREKLDNLTGKRKIYDEKIKAKISLSRYYLEKLNRKRKIT